MDTTADYTVRNLTVNGTLSGTVFTTLFSSYATSSSLNAKENAITVVAPLLKSTPSAGINAGKNVLSLDTAGAYTVGALTSVGPIRGSDLAMTGQITCQTIGTRTTGVAIQNTAGIAVAVVWNDVSMLAEFGGRIIVRGCLLYTSPSPRD